MAKQLCAVYPSLNIGQYLEDTLLWDYQTVPFSEYIMSSQFFSATNDPINKKFLEIVASEYRKHKKGCELVANRMKETFKK